MAEHVDDTRNRLLDAAGEIFAEKGFQAATVREICGRAGANLAAVNYHFRDKKTLYVETVRHAQSCGLQEPPPGLFEGLTPDEKLREYIHRMLSRLFDPQRPSWHTRLLAHEMTEPCPACLEMVGAYVRANFDLLNRILAEFLPPETTQADCHLAAFSVIGQCLHFKIGRAVMELLVGPEELQTYDVARLVDHIAQFSLAALRRKGPAVVADNRTSEVTER
ncbi:MAG: CerR family C-terminal domain-containing protein [Candidatus Nealsonbacteria bacterium]|nr:CerR family C-terminal domain-containing protein [Candidatus Nealsonbacteria bacterium]